MTLTGSPKDKQLESYPKWLDDLEEKNDMGYLHLVEYGEWPGTDPSALTGVWRSRQTPSLSPSFCHSSRASVTTTCQGPAPSQLQDTQKPDGMNDFTQGSLSMTQPAHLPPQTHPWPLFTILGNKMVPQISQ